jgi:hypothetical protein
MTRKALLAGVAYFAIVFAIAFGLGTVRTFVLEPRFDKFAATLIEAPFLLVAILWAASIVPRRFGVGGRTELLTVGVVGLLLQQAADAALGLGLRGLSLSEQYAQFTRPEGILFAVLLFVFLISPMVFGRRA